MRLGKGAGGNALRVESANARFNLTERNVLTEEKTRYERILERRLVSDFAIRPGENALTP